MRFTLAASAIALALTIGTAPVRAAETGEDFPSKPVRIIVGFAGGGPTDVVLRPITTRMSESLRQPFIIDNRPGASGNVGAEMVVRSPADGYTLLGAPLAQLTNNPHLFANMPFDTMRDLQPISLLATSPGSVVVHPSLPVTTLKEFIAFAKARPGKLNFSSTGNGSANHLAGELLKLLANIDMVHVPFKGGAPALNAVVAGEVETIVISLPISLPFIKTGRLRALALCDTKRAAVWSQLPTTAEAGVPGLISYSGPGLLGPARMPQQVVTRLHGEIVKALSTPDVREKLTAQGLDIIGNTPAEFAKVVREDSARWAKVVKAANVRM